MADVYLDDLLGEYSIEIPGNGISQAGVDLIQQYLQESSCDLIPDVISLPNGKRCLWKWDWKVGGRAEYVGTLPKRIAKYFWQTYKVKLSRHILTVLGNLGAEHSGKQQTFHYDIVDHMDWERSDFGQPNDCCFWGCHSDAKEMILDNGGGAIRFFKNNTRMSYNGFARAWLAPYKNCWIIFNGYGLSALAIARILATHLKHSYYKRIPLDNDGTPEGTLWINGGCGYLVGPQQTVLKHSKIDLHWPPLHPICIYCECRISEDDLHPTPSGEPCCQECWGDNFFNCDACERVYAFDNSFANVDDNLLCYVCFHKEYYRCFVCNEIFPAETKKTIQRPDGRRFLVCKDCFLKEAVSVDETSEPECRGSDGTPEFGLNLDPLQDLILSSREFPVNRDRLSQW